MPRCASSKRPGLRADGAGERALLVAEELAFEQPRSGIAAQLMGTKGPAARPLNACRARANSSLPVPLSPSSSTVVSESAARVSDANTARNASCSPMMSGSAAAARQFLFQQQVLVDEPPLLDRRATIISR